jgi:hypothetical protein
MSSQDGNFVKARMPDLKRQADEAFKNQDYLNASVFYTQVQFSDLLLCRVEVQPWNMFPHYNLVDLLLKNSWARHKLSSYLIMQITWTFWKTSHMSSYRIDSDQKYL